MNITCPSCGCSGDEELFGADMEWRRALTHALKLPSDCGPLAGRYVKLFAPLKRNLSSARACKLLKEVSELVLAEEIVFDRVSYQIPSNVWAQSLQIMLDKQDLQRPLPNHNYLKKVAIGQLSKRADIEQKERATTRHNNESSRIHSDGMQGLSALLGCGSDEKKEDVLYSLPVGEQKQWMLKAEQLLKDSGLRDAFITKNSVESEARAMILESQE